MFVIRYTLTKNLRPIFNFAVNYPQTEDLWASDFTEKYPWRVLLSLHQCNRPFQPMLFCIANLHKKSEISKFNLTFFIIFQIFYSYLESITNSQANHYIRFFIKYWVTSSNIWSNKEMFLLVFDYRYSLDYRCLLCWCW